MTRFGAVDCGTNSIRLLISDVRQVDGVLESTELHRVMEIVRLGEGVDATGTLSDAALSRVREALTGYVELMKAENVAAVRMVATSATRDALIPRYFTPFEDQPESRAADRRSVRRSAGRMISARRLVPIQCMKMNCHTLCSG